MSEPEEMTEPKPKLSLKELLVEGFSGIWGLLPPKNVDIVISLAMHVDSRNKAATLTAGSKLVLADGAIQRPSFDTDYGMLPEAACQQCTLFMIFRTTKLPTAGGINVMVTHGTHKGHDMIVIT